MSERGRGWMDVLDGVHVVGEVSDVRQEITRAYPLDPGVKNARVVSGSPHCGHAFLDEGERGWGQPGRGGVEGLDERGSVGGVCGREGDAETEGREDGEGGGEGGHGGVVRGGEDADGGVAAELDGDAKSDDRILVGDADRRVDRLRGGHDRRGRGRGRGGYGPRERTTRQSDST